MVKRKSYELIDGAEWPGGVRCLRCGRDLDDGMPYAVVPGSILTDFTTLDVVCVYC